MAEARVRSKASELVEKQGVKDGECPKQGGEVFKQFLYERVTSDSKEEANKEDTSVDEVPQSVPNQIVHEFSDERALTEEQKLGRAEAKTPTEEPQMAEGQEKNDDEFAKQTRNIFKQFMYKRLTSQIEEEANEGDMSVGEIPRTVFNQIIRESADDGASTEEQKLGRVLVGMADKLNRKYHHEFVEMAVSLRLTPDTAYSTFAKIAQRLFQDTINWGRIVALLLFGYEIAVSVIKKGMGGIRNFLKKIINFVVTFIIKGQIGNWIRAQGGWLAIIDPRQHNQDIWLTRLVVGSAIAAIVYFFVLKVGPKNS